MKNIFLSAFAVVVFAAPSFAGPLQDQITLLKTKGGEVKLPCGTFNEPHVTIYSNVALVGSGPCTVIPPVVSNAEKTLRKYSIRIENLTVDGDLDGAGKGYIGIDFRNVSTSRVRNVQIKNVDYGFLLYESAYYNVFEDAIIDARLQCFQIIDGANENIIRGGRCQNALGLKSGTGLLLRNVDDIKVFGTSFENLDIGIDIDSGAVGSSIFSPRLERMNCGVRINNGSGKTSIFHIYPSNISGRPICSTGGGLPNAARYLYLGAPY